MPSAKAETKTSIARRTRSDRSRSMSASADISEMSGTEDYDDFSSTTESSSTWGGGEGSYMTLSRTAFSKKSTFGRWTEVYLELASDRLYEYRTRHTAKRSKTYYLNIHGAAALDAFDLTSEKNCFAVFASKRDSDKPADRVRAFFKNSDAGMFRMWLKALRRAIRIASGNAAEGLPNAEQFSDPTLIADSDGVIVDCNSTVCELLGWQKGELIGKRNDVLMPQTVRASHQKLMAKYEQTGKRSLVGNFLTPRRLTGVRYDQSKIELWISLGEIGTGAERMFIATMRPFVDEEAEQEQAKGTEGAKSADSASNELTRAVLEKVEAATSALKQEVAAALEGAEKPAQLAAQKKKTRAIREKHRALVETVQDMDRDVTALKRSAAISHRALDMLISATEVSPSSRGAAEDEMVMAVLKETIHAEVERASTASSTTLFRSEVSFFFWSGLILIAALLARAAEG
jgi:PAS domain S-box-containing protein